MEKIRNNINHRNVNSVFLVGEVVDMGIEHRQKGKGMTVRARLKLRAGSKTASFVYVDVYGKRSCSETMALVCQTGNIVYVEGEFRNKKLSNISASSYILVTHIDCLLRRKDIRPPSTKIITLLDNLDPLGYGKKR
jgi:hypothetical protein